MRIQPPDIEAMTRASLHEVYVLDAVTLRLRYVSAGALRNFGYTRPSGSDAQRDRITHVWRQAGL